MTLMVILRMLREKLIAKQQSRAERALRRVEREDSRVSGCFVVVSRKKYNGRMLKHAMMIIRVEEKLDGFHGRLPCNYGIFFGIYS